MRQRGHVLLLLMSALAAFAVAGVLTTSRTAVRIEDRASDDVRLQALWLARSAADAGIRGTRVVDTPVGEAFVDATAAEVVVTLQGSKATLTLDPPRERYRPADSRAMHPP